MQYVAWLRGINVGGNNAVSMKVLAKLFEELGFTQVKTYINSGNIIFETKTTNPRTLETQIERALAKTFRFPIKTVVNTRTQIEYILKHLPKSWSKPEDKRCNVIFLRHTIDSKALLKQFKPKPEIEEIKYVPGALLWSALTSDLTKSNMLKLIGTPIYKEMTIRTLNTVKKILVLMQAHD